ncbi:transforming acidic coiled-coil-containing protein 2-like isoform X2 [Chrysemys picta bellii]|uniref:transforming acidic coiled-coil-containing protein 2-like isoform X2 n=1 Tax=Chrysemys picta bellii TaxID=8478 RepID=UPI0032B2A5F2
MPYGSDAGHYMELSHLLMFGLASKGSQRLTPWSSLGRGQKEESGPHATVHRFQIAPAGQGGERHLPTCKCPCGVSSGRLSEAEPAQLSPNSLRGEPWVCIRHTPRAWEGARCSGLREPRVSLPDAQEQLAAVLGDPVKKRRYQQQVTVFIVGYQESCGQRNSLLSQLQEFFSCSVELGLGEESHSLPDDFPVHMDDVAGTVTAALSSAEAAMSRLADLNKEIVSYVTSALATHSPKRSHRKQVEKAVDKAKEEVVQIKHRLLQAQADVETKERQLKDLQQLSEMKVKESRLFRAQLESTQRRLQGLEQESGAQRAHLEAELRSRDSRIVELDGFLQEKEWLRRDAATQCSDRALSSPAACPGGLLPSSAGAAEEGPPAGRELGEGLAESMVRPEGGFSNPEDTPGQHSEQPQPVGGPLAHSAILGPGALAGPAGGHREAGKEEEDAEGEPATHPAGGERSPSWGAAVGNPAVQTPEASATCELLARRLAALEAELAAAHLQSHEDAEHWERRCRTMAAEWEEERQRLLQQPRQPQETARPAETAQHLETSHRGQPMKRVAVVQPAQQWETAQQVETVLQNLPMQQGLVVQLVQPLEMVQQVQLVERVEPAPQMSAAGSQLTLEARGFPEPTLPPTPAGGAAPSPGPTRQRGAPRAGASPDALSQSQCGAIAAPAAGRRGVDSHVVAFIETLRAGLMAKELHVLARLLDGPCGRLTTELPAAPEEAAGVEIHTLLGNATLVFYSLLESISGNDKMLLQPQDVTSDQGGAAAPALGKGVVLGGADPLALDQHPVGGGHSSHAVPVRERGRPGWAVQALYWLSCPWHESMQGAEMAWHLPSCANPRLADERRRGAESQVRAWQCRGQEESPQGPVYSAGRAAQQTGAEPRRMQRPGAVGPVPGRQPADGGLPMASPPEVRGPGERLPGPWLHEGGRRNLGATSGQLWLREGAQCAGATPSAEAAEAPVLAGRVAPQLGKAAAAGRAAQRDAGARGGAFGAVPDPACAAVAWPADCTNPSWKERRPAPTHSQDAGASADGTGSEQPPGHTGSPAAHPKGGRAPQAVELPTIGGQQGLARPGPGAAKPTGDHPAATGDGPQWLPAAGAPAGGASLAQAQPVPEPGPSQPR